jgi:hypothetical protein
MNYIGIDPSIISTAMVINGRVFNYCRRSDAIKEKSIDSYTKWFDLCKDHVTYRYINLDYVEGYSANEIQKMRCYDAVSDMIIQDILDNIIKDEPIKIAVEGYSYSSTGDIIDLVTFSTLLRRKLLTITEDIIILTPSTLKLESCKLTYKPIEKKIGGKKPRTEFIYRSALGIAGGSFNKVDIFLALVENENNNDRYCTFLKEHKMSIMFLKSIKKPLEDCNDAYTLYLYLRKINENINND